MERDKYLKEISRVLDELLEHKDYIKRMVKDAEGELAMQVYRYHSKKGERTYEALLKAKKIKNLIDYLILLRENKDN